MNQKSDFSSKILNNCNVITKRFDPPANNNDENNNENNNEENLILLCPNCHSLTSTYKGANINYGRMSRKKYYIKEKNQ